MAKRPFEQIVAGTPGASGLVFEAIPQARLREIKAAGVDDAGHQLTVQVDLEGGSPLRCCLRESDPGERMLLIAYTPPGTCGAYAERGPVFIHADPCAGYLTPSRYSPGRMSRSCTCATWATAATTSPSGAVKAHHQRLEDVGAVGRPVSGSFAPIPLERASAGSVSQEVLKALVDEGGVHGVRATACKMTPYARYDTQFRVRHAFDLPGVVLRREVEVLFCWHRDRARPDGTERAFGVTVEPLRQADI